MIRLLATLSYMLLALAATAAAEPDAHAVYQANCATCHGPGRLGGTGPALIPESLSSLKGDAVSGVIRKGRPATSMGLANTL